LIPDFIAIPRFHLTKKRPPGRIGRRFRREAQPVQLMDRTNRKNYVALNSYQPLVLHRPYAKIHLRSRTNVRRSEMNKVLPAAMSLGIIATLTLFGGQAKSGGILGMVIANRRKH
jgi:hypothetical protein